MSAFDLLMGGLPQATALPDMSGINQALAENALKAPPAQAVPVHQPSKFRNFLGAIGDALLVSGGHQPMYRQRMQEQRVNQALSGFLQSPDQAIAALMQVDAPTAVALYRAVHPASETPALLKEYESYKNLPDAEKPAFEKFIQITRPQMLSPVTLGANDTVEQLGGGGGEVTATNPKTGEKVRYNSQTGAWEPLGGATGNPSQPFPGR